jgi:hypothetical protein
MAQFADALIDPCFATGVATYEDHYPGEPGHARIVLTVLVEEQISVPAVVDTEAPWCILNPELARKVRISTDNDYPIKRMSLRGLTYEGALHRLTSGLRNELEGDDLRIDASVFVPDMRPGEDWEHPNFLGLSGLLERMRFAVDPADNAFYFAPA